MYTSFFTAALGAAAQQERMNVTANNLANVNTAGFKPKNTVFSQLVYYNMNAPENADTKIKAGTGTTADKIDTNFTAMGYEQTDRALDYAIEGNGFFRLSNPETGEVTYTRNGRFTTRQLGGTFYLAADSGNLVTDAEGNLIPVNNGQASANPGIFSFRIQNGLENVGENEYRPTEKNGNPYVNTQSGLRNKALETSGTDMINEMTKIIESQRAYSYSLKMVQTSDEVMQTINTLKQ